ncbi:Acyl-CoA dehydrogenase [Rhodococcus rhodochrous J3]|uniref:Acyl-CoA/acyl-ACP dehydrogenase n=2 Tax=Rhodococcus rhodochrous TaxID=1829 RepID=A0AA46X0G6_RHORH|nr:acyl-CoA dehydrogenase family protein [Rhodococcus rhodochrous]MBF4476505.1 acyl-CoA/acyl-ACP dehydrogenase [Rhodococcus rhodochrous]MCD2099292.1 acyl-CoA/acyl-ACP dehydrogenase [Rhodococcus rhodochrous]MCD2123703.1 acyl-CoA/acyl-ACP dehydrogenase [Rhodococcus rhodochrous]MCQ4136268.1 acyl-CoA/acyl-ACP dehydrogenase [Rhodococcus rhodochrous]MDJ0020499.1 acyl-CoA dehydrogenase family protein [Rhodococcus rhodochrous]
MYFAPTEEQVAVRELTATVVASRDATSPKWPDTHLWSALAEANLLGIALPEDIGGSGLGLVELGFALTECGRGLARVPVLYSTVAALAIDRFGSETQRRTWLPDLVDGSRILTVGIDLAERSARPAARRDGAAWILDGVLPSVPWAEHSDRILVAADTPDGTVLLLVDPRAEGVVTSAQDTTNGEPDAVVTFTRVPVNPDEVIAGPDSEHHALQWVWQRLVAGSSAFLLGVCEGALRLTADYTNKREQFGRVIATFQAVKFHAGEAFIDTEAIRVTTFQALWRLDRGMPAEREASIAKFWASEGSARVTGTAQRLHGGIGVALDYPVHRYLLWAKNTELRLGSAQWHLSRLGELLEVSS